MSLPLKWEFPGGKLEPNESEEECLLREIKEELNIEIDIVKRFTEVYHQYPNISIILVPFVANFLSGELKLNEHAQYKLLNPEDLPELDWAAADLPIVEQILKQKDAARNI